MSRGDRLKALLVALLAGCAPVQAAGDAEDLVVRRGAMLVTVDVSGTIRAVDADSVGPPPVPDTWNYKIAMMAEEGIEVDVGAPVLAFDTSELQRRLDEKVSERDAAAVELELKIAAARVARQDEALAVAAAEAERRKARVKSDAPEGITAVIELEKARHDLALAEVKVGYLTRKSKAAARRDAAEIAAWRSKRDRALARVQQIEAAIDQMTVLAPRAGTVIHTTESDGKKKQVGDNAWRAETVIEVVSLDEMRAEGEIDEVDIARVAALQAVSLRLDAQRDLEVRGKVERISHSVQRASQVNPLKIAKLDVAIVEAGGVKLRPGMRFRGKIETARHDDVLLLPLDAVVPTANGPQVYVRGANGPEAVAVELGVRNTETIVVLAGVDEGDVVLRAQEVTQ